MDQAESDPSGIGRPASGWSARSVERRGETLRLTKLNVQNFKMLKDLQMEDLKGLNVLIGHNATGKSTVLEAVGLLLQSRSMSVRAEDCFRGRPGAYVVVEGGISLDEADVRDMADRTARTAGLPDPPEGTTGRILDLLGQQLEAIYNVRAPRQRGQTTSSNRLLRTDSKELLLHLRSSLSKEDPWIAGTDVNRGRLAELLVSAVGELMRTRTAFLPAGRGLSPLFESRRVDQVTPGDAGPWMLQAKVEDRPELPDYQEGLRAFLPHLRSLRTGLSRTQSGRFELGAVEEGLPGTTPADRWSSGTRHLAMILQGLVGLPQGSVMLIEEPELSLHPEALHRLMDRIREAADSGKIQLFVSTHSPRVVYGLRPETDDHGLWQFTRGPDGGAEVLPRVTEAEVADAMDSLLRQEG